MKRVLVALALVGSLAACSSSDPSDESSPSSTPTPSATPTPTPTPTPVVTPTPTPETTPVDEREDEYDQARCSSAYTILTTGNGPGSPYSDYTESDLYDIQSYFDENCPGDASDYSQDYNPDYPNDYGSDDYDPYGY